MSENETNKLYVNAQYIKDLSFESPNSPDSLSNKDGPPKINVDVNVYAKPFNEKIYEVALSINGKAMKKDTKVFEVELIYAGIFVLPKIKLADELEKKTVLIDAPQLLFPYARSIISNVTRDGGFLPLVIQPIDFERLYESRKKKESLN